MTTSLVPTATVPTIGYPKISEAYLLQIRHLHARRCSAALIFAQETMNNHEDAAAAAFADYYEASVEHQLLWSAATADSRKEA